MGSHRRLDRLNLLDLLNEDNSFETHEKTLFITIYALPNGAESCTKFFGPVGLGFYHSALQIGEIEVGFEGNANS